MPRGPRLDYPGALHHVIIRGIERRRIFRTDLDRGDCLDRLGKVVFESGAALYAWALMPNHAHALLRTGPIPLSRLMHRWLSGYVNSFNRRYKRCGYLFQNRFKSTLVEEETYLLELVRYIHLNPVRSRMPVTVDSLDRYPWTGHAVLLGLLPFPSQDTDFVLEHFGAKVGEARRAYRVFVRQAANQHRGPDLEGGGLRRSADGWERLPVLSRGRERWAFDERVLGSSDFVHEALARLQVNERPARVGETTVLLEALCQRVASRGAVTVEEIGSSTLRRDVLDARAVLSYVAVRRYGLSLTTVARHLGVSRQSIARGLSRAQSTLQERNWSLDDFVFD